VGNIDAYMCACAGTPANEIQAYISGQESVIGYYVVLCFYPILAVEVHVIMTSLFSNLLGGGGGGRGGGLDSSAPFLYEPAYFTFLTDVVLIFYMYMYRYVTIENFIHV